MGWPTNFWPTQYNYGIQKNPLGRIVEKKGPSLRKPHFPVSPRVCHEKDDVWTFTAERTACAEAGRTEELNVFEKVSDNQQGQRTGGKKEVRTLEIQSGIAQGPYWLQ